MKKDDQLLKISFVGDIMCEKPLLQASRKSDENYNFDPVFYPIKEYFEDSDYVVGNLETVCAGEKKGYTNHIYSFNTPDAFIDSIKNSGIDMVTTATNHCLDRGVEGLKRNILKLNESKINHIGTYLYPEDRNKACVKQFKGIKVAFLNYTYGTNTMINHVVLKNKEKHHVNLLKPQDDEIKRMEAKLTSNSFKDRLFRFIFKYISVEQWIRIKRNLRLSYNRAYSDDDLEGIESSYLNQIKTDITKAKSMSDYVIMCMHSGGQFNESPGKFSEFMMDFMRKNGVDAVIGTHPHVVQKIEQKGEMIGAYSLGNFSISPSSVYLIHDHMPEYGIMLHLYLKKIDNNTKLHKKSFTIIKMIEDKDKYVKVYPIDKLYNELQTKVEKEELIIDTSIIYNKILKQNIKDIDIKKEYFF